MNRLRYDPCWRLERFRRQKARQFEREVAIILTVYLMFLIAFGWLVLS